MRRSLPGSEMAGAQGPAGASRGRGQPGGAVGGAACPCGAAGAQPAPMGPAGALPAPVGLPRGCRGAVAPGLPLGGRSHICSVGGLYLATGHGPMGANTTRAASPGQVKVKLRGTGKQQKHRWITKQVGPRQRRWCARPLHLHGTPDLLWYSQAPRYCASVAATCHNNTPRSIAPCAPGDGPMRQGWRGKIETPLEPHTTSGH